MCLVGDGLRLGTSEEAVWSRGAAVCVNISARLRAGESRDVKIKCLWRCAYISPIVSLVTFLVQELDELVFGV